MRPGAPNDKSKTCYLVVVDATGQFYHSVNGFEAFDNAHSANYAFALADTNGVGWYDVASLTGPADGVYDFWFYERAGGAADLQADTQFWVQDQQQLTGGVWAQATVAVDVDEDAIAEAVIEGIGEGIGGVNVVPLTAEVVSPYLSTFGAITRSLSIPQNMGGDLTFAVLNGDGEAYDLTGKTVRFIVHDNHGEVIFEYETGGAGVTLSDNDDGVTNQVTVTIDEADTAVSNMKLFWKLRVVTDANAVVGSGPFAIPVAPAGGS